MKYIIEAKCKYVASEWKEITSCSTYEKAEEAIKIFTNDDINFAILMGSESYMNDYRIVTK